MGADAYAISKAVGLLVVAFVLAGCTPEAETEAAPTPVPTSPAPGADLICGMARDDIEAVTGSTAERTQGELSVVDGAGSGECVAWAPEDPLVDGPLLSVVLAPAASAEGDKARAQLAGDLEGVREPEEVYTSHEGAIWGDVLNEGESTSTTTVGTSDVFVGDSLVTLLITRGAEGRDRPDDQLALGLEPGSGDS